jgi:hypothetical protein
MNTFTRWLAIPLSRIPLLKHFLYPARIVIRKKPVSEHEGIATAWLPFRYGVMPDGSEISLGCTVDTARDLAEQYYGAHLMRVGVRSWAPIRTKGSDFHPLDPLPLRSDQTLTGTVYAHFPARTWRERRLMWREYIACRYEQAGHIQTAFRPTVEGRNRG